MGVPFAYRATKKQIHTRKDVVKTLVDKHYESTDGGVILYSMNTSSTAWIRFIKGAGAVLLAGLVSYIADSAHLTGILNASLATIVSGMALVIEGMIKDSGHGALFGLAK